MSEDLEDVVMNKQVSFSVKDMKWVITSVVVVVLWIVTAFLWVKDKDKQQEKIGALEKANGTLVVKVATLEGKIDGVNEASKIFMENSPSENKYRINIVEKRVDQLEKPGYHPPPVIPDAIRDTTVSNLRSH